METNVFKKEEIETSTLEANMMEFKKDLDKIDPKVWPGLMTEDTRIDLMFPPLIPHLQGFKEDIMRKLSVSSYKASNTPIQSNSDFILIVKLRNRITGFGTYSRLKVTFIPNTSYVQLLSSPTITIYSELRDGSNTYVSFRVHALRSEPAYDGNLNPEENIGLIKVTGNFEGLPWVNEEHTVRINITPL